MISLVCPEPHRDVFCSQEKGTGSPRAGSQRQEAAGAADTGDVPLDTLPGPSRNSPCWGWDTEFHANPSTARIWAAHKTPSSLSDLQPGRDSQWDTTRDLSCRHWELQSCLSIPFRSSGSSQLGKHLSGWNDTLHYYSAWVGFKRLYGKLHCFLLIVLSFW